MTRVASKTRLALFTTAITTLFVFINYHAIAQFGRTVVYKDDPNFAVIRNSSSVPAKDEQLFGFGGNTRRVSNDLVVCTNGSKTMSDGVFRPIPKIIHQLDLRDDRHSKLIYTNLRHSREKKLAAKYPGFKFVLWNSLKIEGLLRKSYPWMRHTYHHARKENATVQRQIARYVILHATGGVFLDTDSEPFSQNLINLHRELNAHQVVLPYAIMAMRPSKIQNHAIMAGKGHAFIAHVLRGIPNALHPVNSTDDASFLDFWLFLKERVSTYRGKHDICFLPSGYFGGERQRLEDIGIGAASTHRQYSEFSHGPSWVQLLSLFLMIVLIVKFERIVDRHVKVANTERSNRTVLDIL